MEDFGDLLKKVPIDYDANKIGFILLNDSGSEEVTPKQDPKQKLLDSKICYICKKSFQSVNNVLRHLKKFHSGKEFKCEICSFKFPNKHKRIHKTSEEFICDQCGTFKKTKKDLINHIGTHQGLLNIDIDM